MTALSRLHRHAGAAHGRLMLWCGALVLLLQLFALTAHDHDTEARAQECVACSVQAQSQAAPPAPACAPAGCTWVLSRVLFADIIDAPAPGHTGYLLPQPHAPPASPSFA